MNGRDVYLGRYGSPESRAEYDRLLAEWLCNGRNLRACTTDVSSSDLTVNELIVGLPPPRRRLLCQERQTDGGACESPPLLSGLYVSSTAIPRPGEFGPLALKAVRGALIETGICRSRSESTDQPDPPPLQMGCVRGDRPAFNPSFPPVGPRPPPRSSRRPGVRAGAASPRCVRRCNPAPTSRAGSGRWSNCSAHRDEAGRGMHDADGRYRNLGGDLALHTRQPQDGASRARAQDLLGPHSREILRPLAPGRVEGLPVIPSGGDGRSAARCGRSGRPRSSGRSGTATEKRPQKQPGEVYTTESFVEPSPTASRKQTLNEPRSVSHGGFPSWHPHQLRHSAATRLRKEFGLDVTPAVLGHSSAVVTRGYTCRVDGAQAAAAMASSRMILRFSPDHDR